MNFYVLKPSNRVSLIEAMEAYKNGLEIQCRILDKNGFVKEIENYHINQGLDIALEFNEILNGHFFILRNGEI